MKKMYKKIVMIMCVVLCIQMIEPVAINAAKNTLNVWATINERNVNVVEKGSVVTFKYQYENGKEECQAKISIKTSEEKEVLSKINASASGKCELLLDEDTEYICNVKIYKDNKLVADESFSINSVVGLPNITKQPEDIKCYEYTSVKFEVNSSNPDAEYQWYKTLDKNANGEIISGASSKTYSIPDKNVTMELNNVYFYCIVTANGLSVKSEYAMITVLNDSNPGETVSPATQKPNPPTQKPGETKEPTSIPQKTDEPLATSTPKPSANPLITQKPTVITPTTEPVTSKTTVAPVQTTMPRPVELAKPSTKTSSIKCKYTTMFNANKRNAVIKISKIGKKTEWVLKRSKSKKGKYVTIKQGKGSCTITDNNYYKNKTYYQLIVGSENDKKIYKFSIKTTVNPKLKEFKSKKNGRTIICKWKFDKVKSVEVYINTGNGWKKLGEKPGKESMAKINIPLGYTSVGIKIRGYNKVGNKKFYSAFSKASVKKM